MRFFIFFIILALVIPIGSCAKNEFVPPSSPNEDTSDNVGSTPPGLNNNDGDNDSGNGENQSPAATVEKMLGVHVHFTTEALYQGTTSNLEGFRAHIDRAATASASVIRVPGDWRQMQPINSTSDTAYVNLLMSIISYAQSKDLKVILMFAQTPCWAIADSEKPADDPATANVDEQEVFCNERGPNGSIWRPATNVADYANAIAELVQAVQRENLNDALLAWEIWNEPNSRAFWADPSINLRTMSDGTTANVLVELGAAQKYTSMLNAAYDAIKAVNPDAIVLGGSLASADHDYLQSMMNNNAKFDALSIHPYVKYDEATNRPYGANECPGLDPLAPPWCYAEGVNNIRATLQNAGDESKIWFTEFGYSADALPGGAGTQDEQARLNQQLFNLWLQWDDVPVAIYYRLFDDDTAEDEKFGLFTKDLNEKTTLTNFRNTVNAAKAQNQSQ